MASATAFAADRNAARIVVGKVVFLRQEEYDRYILAQIEVAAKRKSDSSIVFFIASRERLSADWLDGLKFVVPCGDFHELHEVARSRMTVSGHGATITTRRRKQLGRRPPEQADDARAIFMTARVARSIELR